MSLPFYFNDGIYLQDLGGTLINSASLAAESIKVKSSLNVAVIRARSELFPVSADASLFNGEQR